MKILDFQGLTLGHPAQDIWTIVYASTDPAYRAASLEADLRAYYAVLATYMEAAPAFEEFMQEVEERRVYGMVLFSKFIYFQRRSCSMLILSVLFSSRLLRLREPEPGAAAEPGQGAREVLRGDHGDAAGRGEGRRPPRHQGDQAEGRRQPEGDGRPRPHLTDKLKYIKMSNVCLENGIICT